MKVILLKPAEKELKKLTKFDQIAIISKIERVAEESFQTNEEKLKGYRNIYRVRVGDFRIVYKKEKELVSVILIQHRSEVYKTVRRLFG